MTPLCAIKQTTQRRHEPSYKQHREDMSPPTNNKGQIRNVCVMTPDIYLREYFGNR